MAGSLRQTHREREHIQIYLKYVYEKAQRLKRLNHTPIPTRYIDALQYASSMAK